MALIAAQAVLTVTGLTLSLLPMLETGSCTGPLCLSHLHRHSWWLTPPTSFWGGVGAFCMLRGQREGKQSWWLLTAFDLQVLVAPVSVACFLLLGWQALSANAVHSGCSPHVATAVARASVRLALEADAGGVGSDCLPSRRTVFTYATLSLVMQVQAAVCVCGAFMVRSATDGGGSGVYRHGREVEQREVQVRSGRGGDGAPRGWRRRHDSAGRPYYEHKRSGRTQWDMPMGPPSTSDLEDASGLSGNDHGGYARKLCRVNEC